MAKAFLDAQTYAAVHKVCASANRSGRDTTEALHAAGLLRTPTGDKAARVAVIAELAAKMRAWTPLDFLGRKNLVGRPASPNDMYDCVLDWLVECQRAEEEKGI